MARFIILDEGTICETRDEESRPKKRQRTDDASTWESSRDCSLATGPLVRDPEYYKDDGDCYLRVEHTLFKVHGFLLSRSYLFENILNRAAEEAEGTSDESPILLPMETVSCIRALLWVLYARSHEIEAQATEGADIDHLITVAEITGKYHFSSLQSWACDSIYNATSKHGVYIDTCSSANFASILDIATKCGNAGLRDLIVDKWTERVRNRDLPSVPAIIAADKFDLHRLRGDAYYQQVQEMVGLQTTITTRGATQFHADPKLNNGQVMRLLSGYWSLVSYWERLRRNPPKVLCFEGCTVEGHPKCTAIWESRWQDVAGSSKVINQSSANVLAILSCMHEQLNVDQELMRSVAPRCRLEALAMLKQIRHDFHEGLADHFFGCV